MDYKLFDFNSARRKHEHDVAVLTGHLQKGANVWGGGASMRKSSGNSYRVTYVNDDYYEVVRYFMDVKEAVRFYMRRADVLGCTISYPEVAV